MTMYLALSGVDAAMSRSTAEMRKSPGWIPDNVTQFRWGWMIDILTNEGILVIPDDELNRLTSAESLSALTRQEASSRPGWSDVII